MVIGSLIGGSAPLCMEMGRWEVRYWLATRLDCLHGLCESVLVSMVDAGH